MKRIFVILCLIFLVIAVCSCGDAKANTEDTMTDTEKTADTASDTNNDAEITIGTDLQPGTDTKGDTSAPQNKKMSFLHADGTNIVNEDGEVVILKGTNIGGWLLQESWMCMVKGDPQYDSVGWTQMETLDALTERFGAEKARELLSVYRENWITEDDFRNMAELGMNVIRLPFGYWDFMSDLDGTWLAENPDENPGFVTFDRVLELCEKYGIYVVLDMHGCPGGQTKDHTCGSYRKCLLFDTPEYQDVMEKLWLGIAERYKESPIVAGYDIMNEPTEYKMDDPRDDPRNVLYDRMIKAIRKVDPDHMLIVEAIWDIQRLPADPAAWGWENVVYSMHPYGWTASGFSSSLKNYFRENELNVPFYVSEFFDTDFMQMCLDNGWSFSTWTYKGVPSDNEKQPYAIYCYDFSKIDVYAQYIHTETNDTRADVLNDSEELIREKWGKVLRTDSGIYMQSPAFNAWKSLK